MHRSMLKCCRQPLSGERLVSMDRLHADLRTRPRCGIRRASTCGSLEQVTQSEVAIWQPQQETAQARTGIRCKSRTTADGTASVMPRLEANKHALAAFSRTGMTDFLYVFRRLMQLHEIARRELWGGVDLRASWAKHDHVTQPA